MTRSDLASLSLSPHIEHMAAILACSWPRVDLASDDAAIIYLTTMLDDREICFVDIHMAVERAKELRASWRGTRGAL